jgi:imidazolonepropionase-like amidohydrolase
MILIFTSVEPVVRTFLSTSVALAIAAGSVSAQTYLITADKLHIGDGTVISNGQVLVTSGKIRAVGTGLSLPAGAVRLRAVAVTPGYIDLHSHLCMSDLADGGNVSVPAKRAIDAWNPACGDKTQALSGGVTTIIFRPGSGNVFGGSSPAIKLANRPWRETILKDPVDIKMGFELTDNLREVWTVDSLYARAKRTLDSAVAYGRTWQTYRESVAAGRPATTPSRDLGLEFLQRVLGGEVPVHFHCGGGKEAYTTCDRIAREFNLKITFAHAVDSYEILGTIPPREGLSFNMGPSLLFIPRGGTDPVNAAAIMSERGYRVTVQTDALSGNFQQYLRANAAFLVRYGLTPAIGLRAITLDAAVTAGIAERVGSIAVGKDADIVLLDGDPMELTTVVQTVLIDGRIEYRHTPTRARTVRQARSDVLPLAADLDETQTFALRGVTILPVGSARITNGTILVRDGRIAALGRSVSIPQGTKVIDATGRYVIPGLIAGRSQTGLELRSQVANGFMEWHGMDPSTTTIDTRDLATQLKLVPKVMRDHRRVGLTTMLVTPGDAHLLGATGTIIRTDDEQRRRQLAFGPALASIGAAATKRDSLPQTEMGAVAMLRQLLVIAGQPENIQPGTKNAAVRKTLRPVLERRRRLIIACNHAAAMQSAVRIADEFRIDIAIAATIVDSSVALDLASRKIPVILENGARGFTGGIGDVEAMLDRAGVDYAYSFYEGDGGVRTALATIQGDPLALAQVAIARGASPDAVLRALTINPARMMGIADRVGTLEVGKDADFLVLSGPPFSTFSLPELVFIEGRLVHRATRSAYVRLPQ